MSAETEWAWSWLRDRMDRNEQQGIDFSETRLIRRMLEPGAAVELDRAVAEIGRKVPHFTHRQIVLTAILDALKFHAPDQVSEAQEALRRVEELSREAAEALRTAAECLRKQSAYRNRHAIIGPEGLHPVEWIQAGMALSHPDTQYRGANWLSPELDDLAYQYDGKYWPEEPEMLEALADAQEAECKFQDSTLRAATYGNAGTAAATARALWIAVAGICGTRWPADARDEESPDEPIPDFRPTDRSIAALVSLVAETDASNVKVLRNSLARELRAELAGPANETPEALERTERALGFLKMR